MEIINKTIKKRGNYKPRLPNEVIEEIKFLYWYRLRTAQELSIQFDIPRSTISSYGKEKEHIFTQLIASISQKLNQLVDIQFQNLILMKSDSQRRNYIRLYIKTQELLIYSDNNPFKDLIPKSKLNSKKIRKLKQLIDQALTYFRKKYELEQQNYNNSQQQNYGQQNYGQQNQNIQVQENLEQFLNLESSYQVESQTPLFQDSSEAITFFID